MVTAKTQYNLKNAREYFEEHLCVGDYHNEGQRVAVEWIGLGAERLGLCCVLLAGSASSPIIKLLSGGVVTGVLHGSLFTLAYYTAYHLADERAGIWAAALEGVGGDIGFILFRLT